MPRRLHIRTDKDIDQGVEQYARDNGITTSQAARELLRQALTSAEPIDRGWREGYMQGMGQGNKDYQLGVHRRAEALAGRSVAKKSNSFLANIARRR